MRRIVIAIGTTLTGLVLLLAYPTSLNKGGFAGALGTGPPPAGGPAGAASAGGSAAAGSAAAGAGTSAPSKSTFDGATVNTRYGPVQVRITVAGGKVTAIDAVQLPSGNSYDDQVNQFAVPVLRQEAIAAQSARINLVSGATFTSNGYAQSLQSALDKANL